MGVIYIRPKYTTAAKSYQCHQLVRLNVILINCTAVQERHNKNESRPFVKCENANQTVSLYDKIEYLKTS